MSKIHTMNLTMSYSCTRTCTKFSCSYQHSFEYELAAYMHRNARRAPGFPCILSKYLPTLLAQVECAPSQPDTE